MNDTLPPESNKELNLFLEEVCVDVCRFEHSGGDPVRAGEVRIRREVPLGDGQTFADLRVEAPGVAAYHIEVKFGRPDQEILDRVGAKFGAAGPGEAGAGSGEPTRLVLVVNALDRPTLAELAKKLSLRLGLAWRLELWTEKELAEMVGRHFEQPWPDMNELTLERVRRAILQRKRGAAFGAESDGQGSASLVVMHQLLYHLGWWKLAQIRTRRNTTARDVLAPGRYRNVVVVMADMCGFTGYLRDTREDHVTRESLTSLYSLSRSEILGHEGMLYQFVGDGVIALFGVPEDSEGDADRALDCARALVQVGRSTADYWQRHIDHDQPTHGVHIGMAMGELQIMPLRPFSRAHIGAIGDCINLASRLMGAAGEGQIAVTNSLYNALSAANRAAFVESEVLDVKNAGRVRAWRLDQQ